MNGSKSPAEPAVRLPWDRDAVVCYNAANLCPCCSAIVCLHHLTRRQALSRRRDRRVCLVPPLSPKKKSWNATAQTAPKSAYESIAVLCSCFGSHARCNRQLQDGRSLTGAQPGQEYDFAAGKLKRVVMCVRLIGVQLPKLSYP